jgi:hypothetical protein
VRRTLYFLAAVALLLTGCADATEGPDVTLSDGSSVFFPTQPEEANEFMTALSVGPLVVRDGCVLVGTAHYGLPIWRKGFTPELDETGRLVVLDTEGEVVAVEGETFRMGGGFRAEFSPGEDPRAVQLQGIEEWLGYPIPARCLGPDVYGIWIVGEI